MYAFDAGLVRCVRACVAPGRRERGRRFSRSRQTRPDNRELQIIIAIQSHHDFKNCLAHLFHCSLSTNKRLKFGRYQTLAFWGSSVEPRSHLLHRSADASWISWWRRDSSQSTKNVSKYHACTFWNTRLLCTSSSFRVESAVAMSLVDFSQDSSKTQYPFIGRTS